MRKITCLLISIVLALVWLIGIINSSNYKISEIELLAIYIICLSCIISMDSFYGEITLLMYTMGLFLCSYPFMDILGVVDVRENQFFSHYSFTNQEIVTSINIIALTLIAVLFTYSISKKTVEINYQSDYNSPVPAYLLVIFAVAGILAIIYRVLAGVLFRIGGSYLSNYVNEVSFNGPVWVGYLSMSSRVIKALIMVIMVSKPPRKQCIRILIFYFLVSATQLSSGQRGPFIVETLFLIWYYCKYYYKIKIRYMIIPASALMIVSNAVSSIRNNQSVEISPSFLKDFVLSQGVSFDVVANSVRYYSELQSANTIGVPYFLGMVHKYLVYIFSKLFFVDSIFGHGQTQEALNGSSYLGWKLTDIISPYQYSIGRGTGSSFVAENYLFFRYFGVIFLTAAMILLVLYFRRKASQRNTMYWNAVYYIVVQALIYAPRNNFWIFISEVVTTFVILLTLNIVFPKLFKINTQLSNY